MTVFKKAIATLLLAIIAESGILFAAETKHRSKIAAISQAIHDVKAIKAINDSLIKVVYFENNIPMFLQLDSKFSDPENPEYLDRFLKHFDFMINDQVIPVGRSVAIMLRKDQPFTFRIKAKPGKIASLLALVKTSTQDWLRTVYAKAANFLSCGIRYDCHCKLHEDDNRVFMDELVYQHPEMRKICQNPSNIMNIIKKYLTWSEWLGIEAKLPDLQSNNS